MDYEEYEGAVKQQMLKTLSAYQNEDGTVDMDGWLADTCLWMGVEHPMRNWRQWAYEVIGAKGYDELRQIGHVIPYSITKGQGDERA